MNAIFTIVAKNFLPQARTLGDSIRKIHSDLPFHVLLADETEGMVDLSKERYPVIEAKDISIPAYEDMAFKYNLIELSTALKPFFYEYLFDRFQYQKIIYFDPDIYVYGSLIPLFDALDDHFMILTPHIIKLSMIDRGSKPENDFLINGTYNLGFVAFNRSYEALAVLRWWKTRLKDKAYIDRTEGLFVDQKWMNLVPCFYDKGVFVSKNPGHNVAHWNMHERKLSCSQDHYLVDGWPLVFFHFSGFDLQHPDKVSRSVDATKVDLNNLPHYRELFAAYAGSLLRNQSNETKYLYAYDKFDNGIRIFAFQRRLYRRLTEIGFQFENPFSTRQGSFYDLLRKNRMVIFEQNVSGEYGKRNFGNAERKLKLLKFGMLLLKKVIGIRNFHLLMRTLFALCRPEEQTYLLESLHLDLPIRFH